MGFEVYKEDGRYYLYDTIIMKFIYIADNPEEIGDYMAYFLKGRTVQEKEALRNLWTNIAKTAQPMDMMRLYKVKI